MRIFRKIGISVLLVVLVISSVFGAVYYSDIGEFLRNSRGLPSANGVAMLATSSQFQVNGCGEGTVLDKVTNICWDRNWSGFKGSGFDHDGDGAVNWSQAVDYCDNLSLAGITDWSLPNIKEYRRLIPEHLSYYSEYDNRYANDYIEELGFVDTHSGGLYWSKTERTQGSTAWYVGLNSGGDAYGYQYDDYRRAVCSVWND